MHVIAPEALLVGTPTLGIPQTLLSAPAWGGVPGPGVSTSNGVHACEENVASLA